MNAGIIFYPSLGDRLKTGELVAEIFTDKRASLKPAQEKIKGALLITRKNIKQPGLIKQILQ
jgi:thymidine phosphorylase